MVKKGQLEVSKMGSPHQGEDRDPKGEKPKRKGGGSHNQSRARPRSEGSSSKG
jgi:hypothetical protein